MSSDTKFFFAITGAAFVVLIGLFYFSSNRSAEQPLASGRNALGKDSATVKIVEYADFQCPACGYGSPALMQAVRSNADKVRLDYHHFPLSYHSNAYPAAYAAEAAGKQGKFWEMAEMLYDHQNEWASNKNPSILFASYAKALDLNADQFASDMNSQEVQQIVKDEATASEKLNIDSTPTYFINGKKVVGAQTVEQWQKLIDEATK